MDHKTQKWKNLFKREVRQIQRNREPVTILITDNIAPTCVTFFSKHSQRTKDNSVKENTWRLAFEHRMG